MRRPRPGLVDVNGADKMTSGMRKGRRLGYRAMTLSQAFYIIVPCVRGKNLSWRGDDRGVLAEPVRTALAYL